MRGGGTRCGLGNGTLPARWRVDQEPITRRRAAVAPTKTRGATPTLIRTHSGDRSARPDGRATVGERL
ncbi:hypothetical protein GUJ93_ZPchr0006g41749 [Zizania palustris]|uniref:Uncharacterized protein n=1 Tax=Zizania palustris TaxID=103762 RepID=A0A8J5TB05_ZIZPA|nr:hypothetical protein GUJ93_ZPchr0006g41749 [Zizania palustris]